MNMTWMDWTVLAVLAAGLIFSALWAKRLTRSVSGFILAGVVEVCHFAQHECRADYSCLVHD